MAKKQRTYGLPGPARRGKKTNIVSAASGRRIVVTRKGQSQSMVKQKDSANVRRKRSRQGFLSFL